MSKTTRTGKDRDRRARVEQLRREAAAAERRRTLVVLLACAAVAALIVGAATWSYLARRQPAAAATPLADIGVSASAAGCSPAEKAQVTGTQQHQPTGTTISYPQQPPEYGSHWPTPAPSTSHFYAQDRPPVEQLVHNLEHGYTILWYDDSIAKDAAAVDQLREVAANFDGPPTGDPARYKFIVAPYTGADPGSFPAGKHIALTHWSAKPGGGGLPANQQGIAQYCAKVSGAVVDRFVKDYPYTASVEPGGV